MLTKSYAHPFNRTDRSPLAMWWWQLDHATFGAILFLLLAGFVFSFSSSPEAASDNRIADAFFYTKRHFAFMIISVGAMVSISMLSLRGVKRIGLLIFTLSMLTMVSIIFIGTEAKGGQRWLNLGFLMLQPSEFLKPALVIMIAWMFTEGQKGMGVPGVTIAFGMYIAAIALLLKQPDVGQSFLITVVFGACFFISGVPMRWIIGLSAVAVTGLGSLFFTHEHFRNRLVEFFNAKGDHTQIDAAKAAIANGGVFGRGMNEGIMKARLPDLHTDFIYSVAAEEFGLVVTLLLVGIFAYIVTRNLLKAMGMQDSFRQIATSGLAIMLGVQVLINVAVNIAIIPPKGMTLPFISYGGSSMLAMGVSLGLLLALTRKRQDIIAEDDPSQW